MNRQRRKDMRDKKKELKAKAKFRGLGVMIVEGNVYLDKPFTEPKLLGSVGGAQASVVPYKAHRKGAAIDTALVLGPAGLLVGASKKAMAMTVVAMPNGESVTDKIEGGWLIRTSQADALKFNVIAGTV
jgi:hypothetical protein